MMVWGWDRMAIIINTKVIKMVVKDTCRRYACIVAIDLPKPCR